MVIPTSGPIVPGATPATLDELRTWVANFMHRNDLTGDIDTNITLTEDIFNHGMLDEARGIFVEPLRVREMEEVEVLDVDATTNGLYDVPEAFLQHIMARENESYRQPLEYITPDRAQSYFPSGGGGTPSHFTIIGNSIYAYPASANDLELIYYRTIPSLITNETNWLLEKCPSLYLQGVLAYTNDFIKDANGNFDRHFVAMKALMGGLNRSGMVSRYARAGIQMRGVCP